MSKFTKMAITEGFVKLSQEMPIEKITIKKITDICGINRNTFYYYYKDIYDLREEILYTKMQKLFLLDEEDIEGSWKASLRLIGEYANQNEGFIKGMYLAMGRDAFGDKLFGIAKEPIQKSLSLYKKQMKITDDAINDVAYILAKMFAETCVEWIRGKCHGTPAEIMEKAITILEDVPKTMLLSRSNVNK